MFIFLVFSLIIINYSVDIILNYQLNNRIN